MTRFKISPVIGVIIMVAITVILAGAVAWFVFGMSGSFQKIEKYSGYIIEKRSDETGGGEIYLISTDPAGDYRLHVSSNTDFNKIQARDGKIYSLEVVGKEVKSVVYP